MELRQLKYFEKAYEYQNFSEASRLLFISQSTLSQQIKQLEEELDILLFDRIGKRVVPTEAGKAFLPYARKAIQDAESGKQIIKDLKGLETGELHIGATYSLSTLLTDALMVFTQAHPKIKINITFATSDELLAQLAEGRMDCVLSFLPEKLDGNFDTLPLFSSGLYFIAHRSHPLASISSITLNKLSQTPLILPARGFATRQKIEEICTNKKLHLHIGMEVNDVQTIIRLLEGGKWATILTEAAVHEEPDLVKIPILSVERLATQGFLFWAQGVYRKKSTLAFAKFLQQVIAPHKH